MRSIAFRIGLSVLFILMGLSLLECSMKEKTTGTNSESYRVYVGTYTSGESEGIYIYQLNRQTGELSYLSKFVGIDDPSFLAIHPAKTFLYSVSEGGKKDGSISAFRINSESGELEFLNKQSSGGRGPAHVNVDGSGRWVLTANYGGGSVAILPIRKDGSLGPPTDVRKHQGSGIDPKRQKEPHPHSIWVSPDNRFAFVPDLGIDKIMIYKLDLKNGKLLTNDPPYFKTAPGAGPRHFTFHPNGRYAFVINELNSTITAMKYDATAGALTKVQTIRTVPDEYTGINYCADIHTSPDGRYVYGSNRGHNSIAVFSFDDQTGTLKLIECESTQGDWPRNFAIDPDGKILLAANQRSDNVVTFFIDQKTGELTPTGFQAEISMPVCLKLL